MIDPYTKSIFVFRGSTELDFQMVRSEGELDGEDLVPGFKLKVDKLFRQRSASSTAMPSPDPDANNANNA